TSTPDVAPAGPNSDPVAPSARRSPRRRRTPRPSQRGPRPGPAPRRRRGRTAIRGPLSMGGETGRRGDTVRASSCGSAAASPRWRARLWARLGRPPPRSWAQPGAEAVQPVACASLAPVRLLAPVKERRLLDEQEARALWCGLDLDCRGGDGRDDIVGGQ